MNIYPTNIRKRDSGNDVIYGFTVGYNIESKPRVNPTSFLDIFSWIMAVLRKNIIFSFSFSTRILGNCQK